MRYFLQISYLGTQYCGWQIQPNAATIQQIINEKLGILLRKTIETTGQGRTDAGVHARKSYAHFDFDGALPIDLVYRLNKILPHDIAAQKIMAVAPDAHARFDAQARRYEYIINTEKNPFEYGRAMYLPRPLNYVAMNAACEILMTYNDFGCFSKSHTQVGTNICKITHAAWTQRDDKNIFCIEANRFLRNMVRAIVGTMLDIGHEKLPPDTLHAIIKSQNRSEAGQSVPACGLYLIDVKYPFEV